MNVVPTRWQCICGEEMAPTLSADRQALVCPHCERLIARDRPMKVNLDPAPHVAKILNDIAAGHLPKAAQGPKETRQ